MAVNIKKSLKLLNNTKYFNKETSRSYVTFASPCSYQSRRIKIEGYETRLYWHYRYCEDHSGQTFFYTLTYNDQAMPKFQGINCFDYEDLRDLLTGGFRKQLLRKYGTCFKYFIGAELGDGKGERGLHNNPHYHILFFLEPASDERYPYIKISSEDFRHLVRKYWQGFDEDRDGFHDYNEAKYGIAREGENCGLVTDYRACCYCAKYVTKDAKLKKSETKISQKSRLRHRIYKRSVQSYEDFFNEYVLPTYRDDVNEPWHKVVRRILGDSVFEFEDLEGIDPIKAGLVTYVMSITKKRKLDVLYNNFCTAKIDCMVHDDIVRYRNRYCNKCRISQGVGDYALDFIDDYINPTVQVPSKNGFKNRPLPMYLYRKLYTDVVRPTEVVDGVVVYHSPVRILNDLGIEYKVSHLDTLLKKKAEKAEGDFNAIINNEALFERMRESDINTAVFEHYNDFQKLVNGLLEDENNNLTKIFQRYAEFKVIYEDRFFAFQRHGDVIDSDFPVLSPLDDYRRFITPTIYSTPRRDYCLYWFFKNGCKGYLPYREHPYFLRFIGFFNILDMCSDYWFVKDDDKAQQEAEDIAAVKRFHSRQKVKEFYKKFQVF